MDKNNGKEKKTERTFLPLCLLSCAVMKLKAWALMVGSTPEWSVYMKRLLYHKYSWACKPFCSSCCLSLAHTYSMTENMPSPFWHKSLDLLSTRTFTSTSDPATDVPNLHLHTKLLTNAYFKLLLYATWCDSLITEYQSYLFMLAVGGAISLQ